MFSLCSVSSVEQERVIVKGEYTLLFPRVRFPNGDYDEVATKIRDIRGIGEGSSYFIMVRGLGRMERVSTVDQELAKAAANIYNEGQLLAPSQMQLLLNRYGKYQGIWALYLRAPSVTDTQGMME